MGWCYDFYKVYKTKKEDADMWDGKSTEELPEHLRFLCDEYHNNENLNGFEEIQKYLLPVRMMLDGTEYQGYLATMYPVALFGSYADEVLFKTPCRPCWYRFVKLTNSKAKELIKFCIKLYEKRGYYDLYPEFYNVEEYKKGVLGKNNKYKRYPGKLRNIFFYHHQ